MMQTFLRKIGLRPYQPYRGEAGAEELAVSFFKERQNLLESYRKMDLVDSFETYRRLIAKLRSLSFNTVPLKDLFAAGPEEERRLSLRFDVDVDPLTALRLARYNAQAGISASFYLLHSAYYYGRVKEGIFYRNPLLAGWLRGFLVAGCEMGLHADPFPFYEKHGIDGAAAVREEIEWMRSQGIPVRGTTGHNSFPVYGAESFEIFKGREIWKRRNFKKGGIRIPLGELDEQELGLTYEGNSAGPVSLGPDEKIQKWLESTTPRAAQDENWMRTYLLENPYCRWGADQIFWLAGRNRWAVCVQKPDSRRRFDWNLNLEQMLKVLSDTPSGTRSVLIMHPVFFSEES